MAKPDEFISPEQRAYLIDEYSGLFDILFKSLQSIHMIKKTKFDEPFIDKTMSVVLDEIHTMFVKLNENLDNIYTEAAMMKLREKI